MEYRCTIQEGLGDLPGALTMLPDATEAIQGLIGLVELIDWIWLGLTVPVGIILLYFGYRFFEILKFLAGFVIGGLMFGSVFGVAAGNVGAAILGLIVGGIVSGFVFRWLINLVPIVIGAMALATPCFIYLQASTDMEERLVYVVTGLAAGIGGGIGFWVRVVATVVVTSFLGAMLIVQVVAKIHLELGGLGTSLVAGGPSSWVAISAIYVLFSLGLLLSGAWVQFRNMAKSSPSGDDVDEPGPVATAIPATPRAPGIEESFAIGAGKDHRAECGGRRPEPDGTRP